MPGKSVEESRSIRPPPPEVPSVRAPPDRPDRVLAVHEGSGGHDQQVPSQVLVEGRDRTTPTCRRRLSLEQSSSRAACPACTGRIDSADEAFAQAPGESLIAPMPAALRGSSSCPRVESSQNAPRPVGPGREAPRRSAASHVSARSCARAVRVVELRRPECHRLPRSISPMAGSAHAEVWSYRSSPRAIRALEEQLRASSSTEGRPSSCVVTLSRIRRAGSPGRHVASQES